MQTIIQSVFTKCHWLITLWCIIFSTHALATTPIKFHELQAQVRVFRSSAGVPHIYAHNEHDAYFMMGYVEARDRFFQMDCARRYYEGKSAELFGEKSLEIDRQIRRTGLPYYAAQSLKVLTQDTRGLLQAYSDGVNKYLKNNKLPDSYKILHLTQKNIPEWTIQDSLAIARGVNANVSSLALVGSNTQQVLNLDDVSRTESFLKYIQAGKEQGFKGEALWLQDINRSAPNGMAITVQNFFNTPVSRRAQSKNISSIEGKIWNDQINLQNPVKDDGSNIFVIDGKHSTTGYPILANDSHYPLHSPPLWYLIDITVDQSKNPIDAQLSVLIPGSFIYKSGNNREIAWGSTTSRVDISDVYIEHLKLDPQGIPTHVLFMDKSLRLLQIKQIYYFNTFTGNTLEVAKRHPLQDDTFLIAHLNNGPLLYINGDKGYGVQSTIFGNIQPRDFEGYLSLPKAKNLQDFKRDISLLDISYYNFGYADRKGNIAFFESGEIPLRRDLENGKILDLPPFFIRDSRFGEQNTWIPLKKIPNTQSLPYQIIPFAEMPHTINPKQGFFVNSNNDSVGLTLQNAPMQNHFRSNSGIYFIAFKFATGERAQQITDLIQEQLSRQRKISLSDVKKIQTNNQSYLAKRFIPYILTAFDHAKLNHAQQADMLEAINRLRHWDFTTPTGLKMGYNSGPNNIEDSIASTIFYVWQGRFFANTIEKTLLAHGLSAENYQIYTGSSLNLLDTFKISHGIGASGLNFFVVKGISDPDAARDYLILKSLREALDLLKSKSFAAAFSMSLHQNDYRWGRLHRITFTNPLNLNIPTLGGFNNLSPELPGIPRDGGIETINAASFNGLARSPADFVFASGASLRHIIAMQSDQPLSLTSLPGGEGEEPNSSYFSNLLPAWLIGEYFDE